jgi:hypothetical protein
MHNGYLRRWSSRNLSAGNSGRQEEHQFQHFRILNAEYNTNTVEIQLKIRNILVCILLAVLIASVVYGVISLRQAAIQARADILSESAAYRQALTAESAAYRKDLSAHLAAIERLVDRRTGDALEEVRATRVEMSGRIGDALTRVDAALETVEALRSDIQPTLDNAAGITGQVNGALPLFLDCDHNADCVFNRYVGAARGIERASANVGEMSTAFRAAVPRALVTWEQIGSNATSSTGNIARITTPKWYDRLPAWGYYGVTAGASIWSTIHK